MRSFGILSLVAAAAFSLFAAAAPAPGHTHVDVGAAAAAHAHVQRDVALKSVPVILTQLTIDLTPSCEELSECFLFFDDGFLFLTLRQSTSVRITARRRC